MSLTAPLEALLFAVGSEGLTTEELAHALQLNIDETLSLCKQLQAEYEQRESGLAVTELAGTWQLVTRSEYSDYIRRLAASPSSTQLSAAALEVLSIVAYKQPVSRMDIESIRGVQSDRVVATLAHRQLIKEVGRKEAPGRPVLFGTTDLFLQTFGLRSLSELPKLPEEQEVSQDLSLFEVRPEELPRD
ncbi:SMC-Scp complex subunit ScpB [Alicyclobacillus sp. SO9]|uniref:SMC-Scp complex subunit ScpB n=1 Tax=Alicyclobacillus sp. SO9 TaxID=2665646 RepID=UPI0018E6FD2A|nr:SMC-Scp complex subunit ScpB [Alicyclobacillus sp. SO9]QQE81282.1 SMC-Scp complex subunit ScpB [Alicyclobacillus sp. SO9]